MSYDSIPPKDIVDKTIASLNERGIAAEFVSNGESTLSRLEEIIPPGAEVMTGASVTLDEIGFTDLLRSGKRSWKNRKDRILSEKDPAAKIKLRREATLAEYFLGSVHAVTEDGEIFVASASGSQLSPYAFSSPNVIWVVGTQKIVPGPEAAAKRIEEYIFPLEDARMKGVGRSGSSIDKILIIKAERSPSRKLRLIFVGEKLGF